MAERKVSYTTGSAILHYNTKAGWEVEVPLKE